MRRLASDILDADPEAIRLHPTAELWLDCAAFRQHVAAGLPAPTDALAPERLAHLEAAVELYADDFLAGFTLPDSPAFDEWQFFQRESLRQLYGQVLEQLVQAYRGQQAWDAAIRVCTPVGGARCAARAGPPHADAAVCLGRAARRRAAPVPGVRAHPRCGVGRGAGGRDHRAV